MVQEEWDDVVSYAKQYLNLVQESYQIIWWKLFNGPDSMKWMNVLALVELLFCLMMSNGHLERVFSQLKVIKTERRSCLGEDRLDQLLRINTDAPPLVDWDPSGSVDLWWRDKTRYPGRLNTRVQTDNTQLGPSTQPDPSEDTPLLWENLLNWDID